MALLEVFNSPSINDIAVTGSKRPKTKSTRPKSLSEASPPPKVLSRDVSPRDTLSDDIIPIQVSNSDTSYNELYHDDQGNLSTTKHSFFKVPDTVPASQLLRSGKVTQRGSSKERRSIAEIQEPLSSDREESCISHASHTDSGSKQYRVGDTLLYFLLHPRTVPPKTFKSSMDLWWRDRWTGLVDPPYLLTVNHFYHSIPSTASNLEFAKDQASLTAISTGPSTKIDLEEITAKLDSVTTKLDSTAKAIIDALVVLQRDIDRQAGLSRSAMTDGCGPHLLDNSGRGLLSPVPLLQDRAIHGH
ncbi:hypothetical protein M0802_016745 [Mischocyttarus mexicanus]|nr:hypothetical protein M0802_016745 [Mischocyttarus mexicanus]